MSEKKMILALFDDIDPAACAIDELRVMGIEDDQMNVISGIPITEPMLGRPRGRTTIDTRSTDCRRVV
jgi:hypothetical protein